MRSSAPRYTVRAWPFGEPNRGPLFEAGTEEPEVLARWVAATRPLATVTITDEYTDDVRTYREGARARTMFRDQEGSKP